MDVRILGPFEVRESGRLLALGRGKQTALLARLVLDANRVVSVDVLIDDLWGEDPPETAVKMVQVYVSKLRKLLPAETLRTRAPGYLLELPPGAVDLERFEALLAEGRSSLAAGRADETSALLREALALWRSPALAEFEEPFALVETARLGELRLSALEERIDADLALGRHAELASELEALVARHPLRERLRGQHMLAVYRIGRQADALASYQAFRLRLSEELGIEPSSRLRELERRILRQEHDLEIVGGVQPAPAAGEAEPKALPVRYATSDGVSIAYQVVGDGPLDLVLVHGWVCPFQPGWEYPRIASFYRRLAAMGRLILFDKRGTGLSDRVSPENLPDLETRMDDLRAVMDAAGSHRAVLVGVSEGGPHVGALRRHLPRADSGARPHGNLRAAHVGSRLPARAQRRDVAEPSGAEGSQAGRGLGSGDYAHVARPGGAGRLARRGNPPLVRLVRRPRREPRGRARAQPDEQGDRRPPRAARDPGAHPAHLPLRGDEPRCDPFMGEHIPGATDDRAAGRRSPAVGG